MLLEMAGDDILDDSPRPPVDGFLLNEDLGDRPRRLADPLGGGGGELLMMFVDAAVAADAADADVAFLNVASAATGW